MRVIDILLGVGMLNLLLGLWQFISVSVKIKAYSVLHKEEQSMYDFLKAEYGWWDMFDRFKFIFNTKIWIIFTRILGVILVLLGVILIVGCIWINTTEYRVFLFEKF